MNIGGSYTVTGYTDAKKEPRTSYHVRASGGSYYLYRYKMIEFDTSKAACIHINYERWILSTVESLRKTGSGTTVVSERNNTYPNNGISGSYWYEYKGVY